MEFGIKNSVHLMLMGGIFEEGIETSTNVAHFFVHLEVLIGGGNVVPNAHFTSP